MTKHFDALDCLCPMHLTANSFGIVTHVGPTLAKMKPSETLVGQRLLDIFEINKPAHLVSMDALRQAAGAKLHMRFRQGARTLLKGVISTVEPAGNVIINLSFGIGVIDAVAHYDLSSADFAHTDLTIEMLYLVEAKSAAMEESKHLITRLQGARIAAEEKAFTDTLTGLKNRRAMDFILSQLLKQATPFAMVHLDLDHFKAVNDTLGHAAGDHVLAHVARILIEETRADDTVARTGGDEFVLILKGLVDRRGISEIVQRMIRRIEQPISFQGQISNISCSAGTVLSSQYTRPELTKMLSDADAALYTSKRQGRACHTFHAVA